MDTIQETQTLPDVELVDPREAFAKPPFPQQEPFAMPGSTANMKPKPDHGEQNYRGSGKLKGLNAVVTGADSGIGRAIAVAYAREGANVVINFLTEESDAAETKTLVEAAGSKAVVIAGDLREESFCEELIEQSCDRLGSLDILVNNAAFQVVEETLEDFSTEVFDRIFKTNVYAPFWLSRAAMDRLPPGGSIINTVSIQGYNPSPYLLPYAMTKSAMIGMTKAMAKLAMERGIRVNAVAPGPVWTPFIPGSMPKDKFENFGANTLFERPAQPAELAPMYVWLASPEASYVTAEVYGCTGGMTPV
ncbi:putative oxidoreductase YghA [Roseimaritima multifibrata]|uniref:Putative oxidoreductase YghA n=1 Tax=Roseimaritima multifibrata TaxID=1930274 RepID=A0A517MGA0_9BACT|nr:SDR family oxidoreductase [Roseimaritima multifibrata]QDS93896.1 putative oxidoreductase YghA [Roseimaritima multifibrata]